MVLAAVWFHYLQAMKNNIIKVINIIKRQWPHSSCDGREKVFSFLLYFFFVSHGLKLLLEMSIVTLTLIFDTYIQENVIFWQICTSKNKHIANIKCISEKTIGSLKRIEWLVSLHLMSILFVDLRINCKFF